MCEFFSPCDDLLVCGGVGDAVDAHEELLDFAFDDQAEYVVVGFSKRVTGYGRYDKPRRG
jgi:hypothetical protein